MKASQFLNFWFQNLCSYKTGLLNNKWIYLIRVVITIWSEYLISWIQRMQNFGVSERWVPCHCKLWLSFCSYSTMWGKIWGKYCFFLIYNHYCFSALVNTAEIRVSIIHAQLSKTVHGDQFTSKLLLIRTRNSKGQCDNYDFHYRQINTLFHCSQLLSISSKCMSGNFFFFLWFSFKNCHWICNVLNNESWQGKYFTVLQHLFF